MKKHGKLQMLILGIRILLGAAPMGFFIGGVWLCGGNITEIINFCHTIISGNNSSSAYIEVGSWLLSAYILLLPIFGIYYIYASIRRYNQS